MVLYSWDYDVMIGITIILRGRIFIYIIFFFLMIRRPPRSTQSRSSAASDVYKRQLCDRCHVGRGQSGAHRYPQWISEWSAAHVPHRSGQDQQEWGSGAEVRRLPIAVSYTHLRAHETVLDLVCRLLLEKKTKTTNNTRNRNKLLSISNRYNT